MADNVLRVVVTVDGKPAIAELRGVEGAAGKVRAEVAQLDTAFTQLSSGEVVPVQAPAQVAELRQQLAALTQAAAENRAEQASVRAEIAEVDAAHRSAKAALAEANEALAATPSYHLRSREAQEEQRAEIEFTIKALEEERLALQQKQAALKGEAAELQTATVAARGHLRTIEEAPGGYRGAEQAVNNLTRGLAQAITTTGGWDDRIRLLANDIPGVVRGISAWRRETTAQDGAVQSLLSLLGTGAGLAGALTILGTLAVTVGPKLVQMFDDSAEAARRARDAYREAVGNLLRFQSGLASFTIETAGEGRQALQVARGLGEQIDRQLGIARRIALQIGLGNELSEQQQAFVDRLKAQGETVFEYVDRLGRAAQANTDLTEAIERGTDRLAAEARLFAELQGVFGLDPDPKKPNNRAFQRMLAERLRLQQQADALASDLRIETIEAEHERELAEVERTLAERLALLEAALDRGAILEATARKTGALAEEAAATRRAEIHARRTLEMFQTTEQYWQAEQQVSELALRSMGTTEEALLRERVRVQEERLEEARRQLDEGVEAHRLAIEAIDRDRRQAELELQVFLDEQAREEIRREVELRQRIGEARDRELAEERERLTKQARLYEDHLNRIFDVLRRAALERRRFSDAEIELQERRFEEEEQALRDSLRRREIDQREFDLRMRVLAEERAQFEKDAEADRASFVERSVRGLTELVIEELARRAAAYLATQAVQLAASVAATETTTVLQEKAAARLLKAYGPPAAASSIATFGSSAVVGGLAAAATIALIFAALKAFREGGAVEGPGTSTSDSILARLSAGEHVWTAREVQAAGGHQAIERLRDLALSRQLPRFATGGPVLRTRLPVPLALPGTAPGTSGPSAAEVGEAVREAVAPLAREVAQLKANPPEVVVALGDGQARLIGQRGGVASRRSRTARPSIVRITRRGS